MKRPPQFWFHAFVFALFSGMFVVALVLTPATREQPVAQFMDIPLPGGCQFQQITGKPCPGCGLSRSWISLAHWRWDDGHRFHRLGLTTMVYVFLQWLRHGGWLLAPRARPQLEGWGRWLDRGFILLAAALLINWLLILRGG